MIFFTALLTISAANYVQQREKSTTMAWHIPDGLIRKSIIFPPPGSQVDSHPLRVRHTLYLVTKSSAGLAVELAGLGGSDIAEGGEMGWEVRR